MLPTSSSLTPSSNAALSPNAAAQAAAASVLAESPAVGGPPRRALREALQRVGFACSEWHVPPATGARCVPPARGPVLGRAELGRTGRPGHDLRRFRIDYRGASGSRILRPTQMRSAGLLGYAMPSLLRHQGLDARVLWLRVAGDEHAQGVRLVERQRGGNGLLSTYRLSFAVQGARSARIFSVLETQEDGSEKAVFSVDWARNGSLWFAACEQVDGVFRRREVAHVANRQCRDSWDPYISLRIDLVWDREDASIAVSVGDTWRSVRAFCYEGRFGSRSALAYRAAVGLTQLPDGERNDTFLMLRDYRIMHRALDARRGMPGSSRRRAALMR